MVEEEFKEIDGIVLLTGVCIGQFDVGVIFWDKERKILITQGGFTRESIRRLSC